MRINKSMKTIIIICIFGTLYSCKNEEKVRDDAKNPPVGVLNQDLITEEILDREYRVGMTQNEIESMLGKAFHYNESKNRLEATYYIKKELTTVAELSEFTLVYEGGKLKHIRKTWLAK